MFVFLLLTCNLKALGYVQMDGRLADREPRLDERFVGVGATPPDRDMRVRLRRRKWWSAEDVGLTMLGLEGR